jgi:ABC-2 type transport system permease protein
MRRTWKVVAHEWLTAFQRPSFLFFAFGIPVIFLVIFTGIRLYQGLSSQESPLEDNVEEQELKVEGFVDYAGLIKYIPPDLPAGILIQFETEQEAVEAILTEVVYAYYVIPENYLESGEFTYIRPDFNLISEGGQDWMMRWTLVYNMAGGDMPLASRIWVPAITQESDLSQENELAQESDQACATGGYDCEEIAFLRYLPTIFLVIFFMSILMAASLLIYSMSLEKENRVIELLLTSVSTQELLAGKIIGLGILGIVQVIMYLGTVVLIMRIGDQALALPTSFSLPFSYLAWGIVFYIFGYALYAALMAGGGALVPDMKSYSGASMIIASPLFLGYIVAIMSGFNPNSPLATILSLFPLTSPTVMMWRMANEPVPTWQPWLAVILLAITAWLTIQSVARMFHAQELLSGQPFQLKRYMRMLILPGRNV